MSEDGLLQPMTVDQLAGAFALAMGALGSLLLVVWQSRCRLRVNCCYVFRCDREPPPEEMKKKTKDKTKDKDKDKDKDKELAEEEEDIIPNITPSMTPNQIP